MGSGGADVGAASSSRPKKRGRKPGVGFFRGEPVRNDFSVVLCGDGLVVPPNLSQIVPGKAPRVVRIGTGGDYTCKGSLREDAGRMVLQNGWDMFVSVHCLQVGDKLLPLAK